MLWLVPPSSQFSRSPTGLRDLSTTCSWSASLCRVFQTDSLSCARSLSYQIAEAQFYGADTALLIVAMMNDELLARHHNYAHSLGMEPLVEVNNADEMYHALSIGAKVIGVNNRNLHDFNVDMGTTSRLVDMVKDRDVVLCALSGISTPQDVRTYKDQGVKAVLVGESLMRAKDTAAFIRELLDWPDVSHVEAQRAPIVKVTGVVDPSQAQSLIGAGVSMLGLVFDPTLANSVMLDDAKVIRKVFPKPTANKCSMVPLPSFNDSLTAAASCRPLHHPPFSYVGIYS